MSFKERPELVLIEFKKRTLPISRKKCVPVQVPPIAVITDPDILHQTFIPRIFLCRHCQRLKAIRSGNHAAVAVSLLYKMIKTFNTALLIAVQLLIPLYGSKISRR
jgi:hypothetical protein